MQIRILFVTIYLLGRNVDQHKCPFSQLLGRIWAKTAATLSWASHAIGRSVSVATVQNRKYVADCSTQTQTGREGSTERCIAFHNGGSDCDYKTRSFARYGTIRLMNSEKNTSVPFSRTTSNSSSFSRMASADSVSFKVFLKGGESGDDEVKRFVVDRDVSTSFAYLQEKLVALFPHVLRTNTFQLSWRDEDGDDVTIGSDEELILALTEMAGPTYRIVCSVRGKKGYNSNPDAADSNVKGSMHFGVQCDGCDTAVVGFRYKCVVCPDFDLCGACETKGKHSHHNMIRIAKPETAFPRHFFNRLHKIHERMNKKEARRAEKEAARNGSGSGGEEDDDLTPPEQLFSNGGWCRGMRGGRGGPRGRGPPPFAFGPGMGPHGGACGPWFGARRHGPHPPPPPPHKMGEHFFNAMMNGWMGEDQKKEGEKKQCGEASKKAAEAAEARANGKQQDGASASASATTPEAGAQPNMEHLFEHFSQHGHHYLKDIGNMVAAALDPLGVDVQVDIEHGGKRETVKESEQKKEEDSKPEEEEKKAEEEPQEKTATEEVAAAPEKSASPAPSEEDDWTLVKETGADQQQQVFDIPVKVVDEVRDVEPEKEKGEQPVEIPIQVSDQPAKVLFGSPDGTLYPELPKQGETEKAPATAAAAAEEEARPSAPPAAAAAAATAAAAPAAAPQHSDPRIAVALQAMLNMGFTNEGNWLTQLLEAKDGDIGKALDVLQPVRPVRK